MPDATAPDRVVEMRVADLIARWRPGSHDWGWDDERADLTDDDVTERIRARVAAEGIGFADQISPILLGSDGRVWDGHHRIVIAIEQGIETVHVETTWPPSDRDRYRVARTDGALYSAPRKAARRRRCDGHLAPEQHWIEAGDPIVWSALPPDHPEVCNTRWQHAAYCAVCAPTPRSSE